MAKNKNEGGDPNYDFSEIDDSTKNALALSYEAIKSDIDSLPDEVGEFFKSAAKELSLDENIEIKKAEKENEDEEDEEKKKERIRKAEEAEEKAKDKKKTDMIKSAFPGVLEASQKVAVEPLQVEIKKAQDEIATLQDKLQRDEMRIFATTMIPGTDTLSDDKVDELITIKKSMDDKGWTSYVEGQRGILVQLEKSQLFERQSHPAASTPGSAYEQLDSLAKSVIEKSEDKDPGKAWDHVIETNPTLYNTYRKEQAAQAKVGATA